MTQNTNQAKTHRAGSDERPYDIVVFGATGFVGQLVVEYLARHIAESKRKNSNPAATTVVALAGRNKQRLQNINDKFEIDWPLVVADADDVDQMHALAESTKVVLTLVGPYAKYGNTLVDACAAAGTHYVDLAGEVLFVRDSISRNHQLAERTGAKIVHSCGFDSIPSDIATRVLFDSLGPLTYVSMVVERLRGGMSGGTVDSLRNQVAQIKADPTLRKVTADPYALTDGSVRVNDTFQKDLPVVHGPEGWDDNGWAGPFFMAPYNTRLVHRSAFLAGYGSTFRYREVIRTKSRRRALTLKASTVLALTAFSIGPVAKLIDRFLPAPGEGPSAEKRAEGKFTICAYTQGADRKHWRSTVALDKDPGYEGTAMMISSAALALAHDELPQTAGVLTPTVALGDALLNRLRAEGMTINVEKV